MVKLSLVQFSLNPVEVALRPEEEKRSGRGSGNFSSEDDTDGNFYGWKFFQRGRYGWNGKLVGP